MCAGSECPLNCLNLSDCVTIPAVLGRQTLASAESSDGGADSVVSTAPAWSSLYCHGVYRTNALAHTHLYSKWGAENRRALSTYAKMNISSGKKNPRPLLIPRICKKMFSTQKREWFGFIRRKTTKVSINI